MSWRQDDWIKTRSNGVHLTEDEIAGVKRSFVAGEKIYDVAKRLKCSSRTIVKYYGFFRAEGVREKPAKRPLADRHYKSSFEL